VVSLDNAHARHIVEEYVKIFIVKLTNVATVLYIITILYFSHLNVKHAVDGTEALGALHSRSGAPFA